LLLLFTYIQLYACVYICMSLPYVPVRFCICICSSYLCICMCVVKRSAAHFDCWLPFDENINITTQQQHHQQQQQQQPENNTAKEAKSNCSWRTEFQCEAAKGILSLSLSLPLSLFLPFSITLDISFAQIVLAFWYEWIVAVVVCCTWRRFDLLLLLLKLLM